MSDEQIELSSSGLKVSYLRFLADGAAGMLAILILVVGYYNDLPVPFSDLTLHDALGNGEVGAEAKILLIALLLLLAVPLGLVINGFGWFSIGWLQFRASGCWLKRSLEGKDKVLVRGTNILYNEERLRHLFGLTPHNFYQKANFYEEVIASYKPSGLSRLHHVEGLKRMLRSAVVIMGGVTIYLALIMSWWSLLSLCVAGVLSTILSLLEYYHSLAVLFRAYILAMPIPDEPLGGGDLESIVLARIIGG